MCLPRETENTKKIREIARNSPRKSMPQQMGDKWSNSPSWARGIVLVLLAIAGSSAVWIQIIQAFKG